MVRRMAGSRPSPTRIDRNWNELLQELRVAQTGVQILTAFLLTVPFSNRFGVLTTDQRVIFLIVLLCAMSSTILLLTPVALHREVFRRGERVWLVSSADHLARAGLILLAAANTGAIWLVADVVFDKVVAAAATGTVATLVLLLWWALPWARRRRRRASPPS